ncbi:MAG: DNA replication and repair protein RecF [Candidatus Saccharibacteria bacterium]|nr:DNA replication and repair protein RecF [Candidatus Saccharibacteria bacterium]
MAFQLRVQNFRSHADYAVELPAGISIITGPNGSGKTSLIEAIYMAYTGKSWRSNFDEIYRHDNDETVDWWRIDIADDVTDDNRTIKYQRGQKTFTIGDKTYKRLPQSARRPVILFEPNDMQLLYGSPSRRRQFLDRFIAQIEPIHQTELSKFERILKQRNNLLKQDNYSRDELMIWDIQFSTLSSTISARRRQYLQSINKMLSSKYSEIAGFKAVVCIKFQPGAPATNNEILTRLTASSERVTPIGAQKDDYKFIFGHSDAKVSASRGENRTIIFAMLGVITDLARELSQNQVIVLLDDIDSELDRQHRQNLYNMSSWQTNTIATTLEYHGADHFNIDLS